MIPFGEKPTAMPFIVGYHRVVEDFERSRKSAIPSMLISAAMFEQHIDWLAKRFDIVSLDEIGSHLESGRHSRKPAAAITFDDGYQDVYQFAIPLLRRKGIPAAVFVVTSLVGKKEAPIFDRFYLLLRLLSERGLPLASSVGSALRSIGCDEGILKSFHASHDEPFHLMTVVLNTFSQEQVRGALALLEERTPLPMGQMNEMMPMTWEMLEGMNREGFTIGSHTASHRLLPSETLKTVAGELQTSKLALEARLKTPIHHFAYPDGRYTPAVVEAVNSTGYRYAYGICRSRDRNFPLLTIPRKVFWEKSCVNALGRFSPSVMNCHVNWLFDRKGRCEHNHKGSYPE
jgi:peptidoglycan/xylan/chitin deacetylase (PgdA/CDA1 family)